MSRFGRNNEYMGYDDDYISDDELLNDEYLNDGYGNNNNRRLVKGLVIGGVSVYALMIILLIIIVGIVAFFMFKNFGKASDDASDSFFNTAEKEKNDNDSKNFGSNSSEKNDDADMVKAGGHLYTKGHFDYLQGENSGYMLKYELDKVVTNNKNNTSHIITVEYKGFSATSEEDIVKVRDAIYDGGHYERGSDYYVSVDKGSDGWTNKITITKKE